MSQITDVYLHSLFAFIFVLATPLPHSLKFSTFTLPLLQAIKPHRSGKPIDQELSKSIVADFEAVLDQLEKYFLSRGDFIAGPDVTLADIFAICELTQVTSLGFDITRGRPRLAAWVPRIKAKLQPHFDDVHQIVMQFASQHQMV